MASLPGFRFDVTGASGSQGLLSPRNSWRAYVFPRGGYAAQDSTGTLITFDSASVASRFATLNWVQVGLSTANIRQVSGVGGNSISLNTAVTVSENDRVFLVGNTEPTVSGGSATYTTPNTLVRQRDDDGADLYTNSMITTNSNGLVQGFAQTGLYDVMIQDGNQANQGSVIDLPVGVPEGISVSDWAFFGVTVTIHGALGVTGTVTTRVGPGQVRYVDGFVGVNGGSQIANAIANLPTSGGVVDVRGLTGTVTVTNTITIDRPCVLLLGNATITGASDPLIDITSSNCSIVGLGYNTSALQNSTADANIIRIVAGVSNVLIEGCLLDSGGKTIVEADFALGNCIYGAGTSASQISNIVVRGCKMIDGHNGCALVYANNSVIRDNLFEFTHNALSQVFLRRTFNCVVSSNVFRDTATTSNAVWINAPANDPALYNVVSDNSINGNYGAEAINCFGAYTTISGNAINVTEPQAGSAGIAVVQDIGHTSNTVHHNSVSGNVVRMQGTSAATAINIQDNGSNVGSNDNTVTGNAVSSAGAGISVGNTCTRNVISSNRVDIQTGQLLDGIIVSGTGALDNVVSSNNVRNAGRHGIHINTATRAVVIGNHVSGASTNGIFLANAHNSIVTGNLLYANRTGLNLNSTSASGIVDGLNRTTGNTTAVTRATQDITAAGDAIEARFSTIYLTGTAVTLTSTPTIADGESDQELLIINVDTSDTITIQDQGSLASSNLRLGAASRALAPRDSIKLKYNATVGDWVELAFSNVV